MKEKGTYRVRGNACSVRTAFEEAVVKDKRPLVLELSDSGPEFSSWYLWGVG